MVGFARSFNTIMKQRLSQQADVMMAGSHPATLFSSVAGLLKCARRAWLPLVFLLCSCGQTGDLYLPASDSKQGEIQKTKAEISVSDAAS